MKNDELELFIALKALLELMQYYYGAIENRRDPENPSPEEWDEIIGIMVDMTITLDSEALQEFLVEEYLRLVSEFSGLEGNRGAIQ